MTDRDPTTLTLEEIEVALERSEAQHEQGLTVPLSRVLERFDANLVEFDTVSSRT